MIKIITHDKCTCGQDLDFTRRKRNGRKIIECPNCGEIWVYGVTANQELYASDYELTKFRNAKEPIPHKIVNGVSFYPLSLCRRWANGENIRLEEV